MLNICSGKLHTHIISTEKYIFHEHPARLVQAISFKVMFGKCWMWIVSLSSILPWQEPSNKARWAVQINDGFWGTLPHSRHHWIEALNIYEIKEKSLLMFHRYSRSDLWVYIHCDSPDVASGATASDLICSQWLKRSWKVEFIQCQDQTAGQSGYYGAKWWGQASSYWLWEA